MKKKVLLPAGIGLMCISLAANAAPLLELGNWTWTMGPCLVKKDYRIQV